MRARTDTSRRRWSRNLACRAAGRGQTAGETAGQKAPCAPHPPGRRSLADNAPPANSARRRGIGRLFAPKQGAAPCYLPAFAYLSAQASLRHRGSPLPRREQARTKAHRCACRAERGRQPMPKRLRPAGAALRRGRIRQFSRAEPAFRAWPAASLFPARPAFRPDAFTLQPTRQACAPQRAPGRPENPFPPHA